MGKEHPRCFLYPFYDPPLLLFLGLRVFFLLLAVLRDAVVLLLAFRFVRAYLRLALFQAVV